MDNNETVHVLQALNGDEAGPPAVDLAAAMRVGRKRLQHRRAAGAAVGIAAVAAVIAAVPVTIHLVRATSQVAVAAGASPKAGTPTTTAPTSTGPTSLSCVEARLPVPHAGQEALVSGADPTGRYLVGRVYNGGHPAQVAIWDNSRLTTFTIPGSDAVLSDVTSNGVAVGSSDRSGSDSTAWIYTNGKLSPLAGPDGSAPAAIGDQGTIGGTESNNGIEHPIVWHSATSTAMRLPLPGNAWVGQVKDVDSDGTIVGTVRPTETSPSSRGIEWLPDGTLHLLPLPTGLVKGVDGLQIHSIRNGVIVADAVISTKSQESFYPVTYNVSTATFTLLSDANLYVDAGNAHGWLVGQGQYFVPTVYTPATGMIALPTFVKHSKSKIEQADGAGTISDSGLIIGGQDTDKNDVIHAVVWTCH